MFVHVSRLRSASSNSAHADVRRTASPCAATWRSIHTHVAATGSLSKHASGTRGSASRISALMRDSSSPFGFQCHDVCCCVYSAT